MKTPQEIHDVLAALLFRHLQNPGQPSFYVWARDDRAIVSVNPGNVKEQSFSRLVSKDFEHMLSTNLGGVPVKITNSRGIYYQVGYQAAPPPRMEARALDLRAQPHPLTLPMGHTPQGPLWLPLAELGSVLIGGTRRMGKTRLAHAWIQALQHGGAAEIWLRDGKNGLEFRRYANLPRVRMIDDQGMGQALQDLHRLAADRSRLFDLVSATSLPEYNQRVPAEQELPPVALFVDEMTTLGPDELDALQRLVAWGGAHGIHPILLSQRTGVDDVPAGIKTNMATRICFPVPAVADSMVVLGHPGAEKLPKTKGRYLFEWQGRLIQVQAPLLNELPGGPQISPRDLDLAKWAQTQHGGRLSIQILINGRGMVEREARTLLDEWQSRGWLDGGGQGVARRLSPGITDLICQSVKVVSKCQSERQSCQSAQMDLSAASDAGAWLRNNQFTDKAA